MNIDEFAKLPFLTPDDVKDGDVIKFVDEGKIVTSNDGQRRWTIAIELDGIKIPYTPWGDVVAIMKRAWGNDSKEYVGRKAKLNIREYVDGRGQDKKAIVLTPLDEKAEVIEPKPNVEDEDIPVAGEKADDKVEIKDGKVEGIPF